MKKLLLFFVLAFVYKVSIAQTYTESFMACDKSYVVTCEVTGENAIKVIVKDGVDASKKKDFIIVTNDFETFANMFVANFLDVPGVNCDDEGKKRVQSYARKLFFTFKASQTGEQPDPVAGLFKLKDSAIIGLRVNSKDIDGSTPVKYKVVRAQVEIKDGYIENIKAYVLIGKNIFVFNNSYGIGFSSITNFSNFNRIRLYESYSSPVSYDTTFYIKLHHLIDYDYNIALDRRDYSPKNASFSIKGGESVTLFKESTKKLFEAHIFTDFVGLNEEKPNGLVQTEVNKKINLNTVQFQSPKIFYRLFKSYGLFQYVSPSVTISKLEQHNKRLQLEDLDSIRITPGSTDTATLGRSRNRYTTALHLYQYQHFSTGFTANIFFFSNHDLKYNFYLNAGVRLGITQVKDSLTMVSNNVIAKTGEISEYSINHLQVFPEAVLTLLPEERFSFTLSQRFIYLKV